MKEKLERTTDFIPAFDKRHPDPSRNYGIRSVECRMILKGKKGAVQFTFSTGILLPETIEEYIKDGHAKYELTEYGHYFLNKPMGHDVGYHSIKRQYEGQDIMSNNCPWVKGGKCYYDGSSSRADEWLDIFIRKGSDEIWKMLEVEYEEIF